MIRPALLVSLALALGVAAGFATRTLRAPDQAAPTCRPSAPERLAEGPKMLIWGNSLAFDRDWDMGPIEAVNCARQGLTAAEAADRTPALPAIDAEAVVLVFGTVELLRGIHDPTAFEVAMTRIVGTFLRRAPDAAVIVFGIPSGTDGAWAYDTKEAQALNAVLRDLDGTRFLSMTDLLATLPAARRSYDGVHLTREGHALLEAALRESFNLR